MQILLAATIVALAAITPAEVARLAMAARIVKSVQPSIPQDVWTRARCIVVIPDPGAAAGGSGGDDSGVMSCRAGDGWSAPAFVRLERRPRVQRTDLVLLVMNESGVQQLLQEKVSVGDGASAAPGPVESDTAGTSGASAETEILAYARAHGSVSGVDASGTVIRPDEEADRNAYGAGATPRTILASRALSAPTQAAPLLAALRGAAAEPVIAQGQTIAAAGAGSSKTSTGGASSAPAGTTANPAPADTDLRAGIVDLQRSLDRLIADATAAENASTTGVPATSSTMAVSREGLIQLRRQVATLLATIDKRD